MTKSVLEMTKSVLDMTKSVLDMTKCVLDMTVQKRWHAVSTPPGNLRIIYDDSLTAAG